MFFGQLLLQLTRCSDMTGVMLRRARAASFVFGPREFQPGLSNSESAGFLLLEERHSSHYDQPHLSISSMLGLTSSLCILTGCYEGAQRGIGFFIF